MEATSLSAVTLVYICLVYGMYNVYKNITHIVSHILYHNTLHCRYVHYDNNASVYCLLSVNKYYTIYIIIHI